MRIEPMSLPKSFGIGLCTLGAVVAVAWGVQDDAGGEAGASSYLLLGNIILVLQCCCMAGLLVLQKPLLSRGVPPTTLTARYYTVAATLTFTVTLLLFPPNEPGAGYAEVFYSADALAAVLFGGVFSVTFVYCALAWATKHSTPTTAALSMTLQPPLNAILSASNFLG